MYAFEPSAEQKMLVEAISRFSQNDLRVKAHAADEENQFPRRLIEKGWELGYLQASIPEKYGGFGEHAALTGVLAAEELAWGDLAGGMAILSPASFAIPILLGGSESQKQQYLPGIIEGEWQPYGTALIEPTFDFDPNTLRCTATRDGAGYLLNGRKTFVPFADQATTFLVYANLDGRTQGYLLSRGTAGLIVGERQMLLGVHALPVFPISLQDVHVPLENRLGGENGHEFAPVLDLSRLALAAMAVGMARGALEYARDYAKEREVFGVKVAQKQAIAFMIAEMATEIEAVRLLVWEAAWMFDNQKAESSRQAYLAHTAATDMAMLVSDRAVQILGGHGYIREHPVELWMRNARGIAMLTGLVAI
jgi:alkylation response protein AidB-like acyl-CoA dehydrogenase